MAYKILLIEDNTDCRELFATLIRHLGYQVVEADDGEVGVQKALSERPDLIFMDLGMPSMSGIKATACLRSSKVTKNIPIVICTAWIADQHHEAVLKSGAREVISKPISLIELQNVLLRYLPVSKENQKVH
jgi:CheY-like chemotaxis protein